MWDEAFPPGTGGGTEVAHTSEEVRTLYFLPLLSDDSRTSQAARFLWLLSPSWLTVLSHRLGTANKIAPGYSLLSPLGSSRTSQWWYGKEEGIPTDDESSCTKESW